jgi:hypothetical protein
LSTRDGSFKLLKGYIWHIFEGFMDGSKFTDQVHNFEKIKVGRIFIFSAWSFVKKEKQSKQNLTNPSTSD